MGACTRDDLHEWADAFYLGQQGLLKKKTFGCPSYYRGAKMAAFLWDDGLGIKLPPDEVKAKVASDPDAYRHFNPGDGHMKNWLIIVRPEATDYDAEIPLLLKSLAGFAG
jgi:hypothetical protein